MGQGDEKVGELYQEFHLLRFEKWLIPVTIRFDRAGDQHGRIGSDDSLRPPVYIREDDHIQHVGQVFQRQEEHGLSPGRPAMA